MPISNVGGSDMNSAITSMNLFIYNYFFVNFGSTDNSDLSDSSHFIAKYKNYSTDMLKSSLKNLKTSKTDAPENKYFARALRLKLRKNTNSNNSSIDHDKHIHRSFWSYVKQHFKQATSLSPSFDSYTCTQFFSFLSPHKSFKIL